MRTLLRDRPRCCDGAVRRSCLRIGSLALGSHPSPGLWQMSWQLAVIALAVGIPAGPARAWNRPGHMVSGAIAYAELKKMHPEVIARVVALLKHHPHYKEKWLPTLQFLPAAD